MIAAKLGALELGFCKNVQKIAVPLSSLNPGRHQVALMIPRIPGVNMPGGDGRVGCLMLIRCQLRTTAHAPEDAGASLLMPAPTAAGSP